MRISDWSSDVCSSDLERPLCVNSAASLNAALPARAITSLATPDNERNNVSSPPNVRGTRAGRGSTTFNPNCLARRSEEHTSEPQSLMRISYAVFCLKKNKQTTTRSRSTQVREDTIQNNHKHISTSQ